MFNLKIECKESNIKRSIHNPLILLEILKTFDITTKQDLVFSVKL